MARHVAHALCAVFVATGIGLAPQAGGAEQQSAAQARAQLEATESAMADIADWLREANAQQGREEKRLQEAAARLEASSLRVQTLRQREQALAQEIEKLNEEINAQQSTLNAQETRFAELLRTLHKQGDLGAARALLSGEAPATAQRRAVMLGRLSAAQRSAINDYKNQLEKLASTQQTLAQQQQQLDQARQALESERQILEQDRQSRQQALAALAANMDAQRSELEQLEIDKAGVQQLIDKLESALQQAPQRAKSTRFSAARGTLPKPVEARISRNFGRDNDGLRHNGINYATPAGTTVSAVHEGRVVFADWLRGAGLLVIVDHGDAYMTLYGNNEALEVAAGDSISAGEPLARSGAADQGGLYFEIRHRGVAQDPRQWLD